MEQIDPVVKKQEGLALFKRGDYGQALSAFLAAAEGFATQDNEFGQAEMLNNMGVIHRLQRDSEAAIRTLREAEEIFARLENDDERAQSLGNLGDLYAGTKQKNDATKAYSEAAALFAKVGDGEKQSQILRALSLMKLRQGRLLEAMMRMEESLRVRPRLGIPQRLFRGMLRFALNLLTGQS